MFRLDWLQAGRATRGTPGGDHTHPGRWPAWGLLACVVLFQTGCQSGPFSHCGTGTGLFSPCGFFGRVSDRVFNRSNGACCPSGVSSGTPIEMGTPSTVVTPGVVSGSTTSPSFVTPGSSDPASDLSPVQDSAVKSRVSPPPNGSSGAIAPQKSGFLPRSADSGARVARRRTDNSASVMASSSLPTSRSAQAPSRTARDHVPADDQDPLDHLPPLDLPGEVTRSTAPASPAPVTVPSLKTGDNNSKQPEAPRESAAASALEPELTSATLPAPEPALSASVGPGLARFAAVDLKLAGGSVPSSAGLNWLVEKGYRTLLDLRESSEVPPAFIGEVTRLGLRYVALPIHLGSIDRDHVARFNFEIAAGEARPLFFFDSSGTRAGALWYIRRITGDRVDHQIARREAEELGLTDKSDWSTVTNYVARQGAGEKSARAESAPPASLPIPLRRSPSRPLVPSQRRPTLPPARFVSPSSKIGASRARVPQSPRRNLRLRPRPVPRPPRPGGPKRPWRAAIRRSPQSPLTRSPGARSSRWRSRV